MSFSSLNFIRHSQDGMVSKKSKSVKMAGNDGFFQNLSELRSKIEQDSLTEDELVCVVEDFENYINQLSQLQEQLDTRDNVLSLLIENLHQIRLNFNTRLQSMTDSVRKVSVRFSMVISRPDRYCSVIYIDRIPIGIPVYNLH